MTSSTPTIYLCLNIMVTEVRKTEVILMPSTVLRQETKHLQCLFSVPDSIQFVLIQGSMHVTLGTAIQKIPIQEVPSYELESALCLRATFFKVCHFLWFVLSGTDAFRALISCSSFVSCSTVIAVLCRVQDFKSLLWNT